MYRGYDLHAYTSYLQSRLPSYIQDTNTLYPDSTVSVELWENTLQAIQSHYGSSVVPALHNINRYFKNGAILSPELPGMNFAVLLILLWNTVCDASDFSLFTHLQETLEDIGTTCLAGITDRLFADWIALHPLE
jgi:hypothetical protein